MGPNLLIVDDDAKLRQLLGEYLTGYGFLVQGMPDGQKLLAKVAQAPPDLIVLDVMLPKSNGLDILNALRQQSQVPVIMLTAKGEDTDRIVGLEMGADDYLCKPFNPRELLARIKAVLRRRQGEGKTPEAESQMIRAAGLELDAARRLLNVQGDVLELSQTEAKVLGALMSRPGAVFTRDELLNIARGRDMMAFDRSMDVHISNLRTKLKPYPRCKNLIKTVWGAGYMFVDQP